MNLEEEEGFPERGRCSDDHYDEVRPSSFQVRSPRHEIEAAEDDDVKGDSDDDITDDIFLMVSPPMKATVNNK